MDRFALLDALRWQIEAGADEALAEAPIDRRGAEPPPVQQPAQATPVEAPPEAAPPPTFTPAASLTELRAQIDALDHPLKARARSLVFADGDPAARVMLVGEAPGADEDRLGKPFVGRSGQLLDRMLAAIDLDRTSTDPATGVYLTNIVVWRPLGNRNPAADDVNALLPYTRRHIALAQPEVIVPLGAVAARALLETATGIMRLRGRWTEVEIEGRQIPCLPMLHPAYLLRSPAEKAKAWRDLLALRVWLEK